jgi:hypothetical protein
MDNNPKLTEIIDTAVKQTVSDFDAAGWLPLVEMQESIVRRVRRSTDYPASVVIAQLTYSDEWFKFLHRFA